jgi:hypothetical protein
MLIARPVKAILFAAAFLCPFSASAQLAVYEDSAQFSGRVFTSRNEYGDEIILAGNARVITKITFEYKGEFVPQGDERARLRIYANTGPGWMGRTDYLSPAEVPLWESPFFPISSGFHTGTVPVPSIKVPQRFTWTVEFSGLTMSSTTGTNDLAGLLLYGTPSIGSGFNDFWEHLTTGWQPSQVPGAVRNDFGVLVTAIPEAIVPRLTAGFFRQYLLLTWPVTDTSYILQGKTSATGAWVDVSAPPTRIGDTYQRVLEFGKVGIFRLRQTAPRAAGSLEIFRDGNSVRIRWPAAASGYVLQNRSLLSSLGWTDMNTPAAPVNGYYEIYRQATSITEMFRLRESIVAATMEITQAPGAVKVRWPEAAPNYILQFKSATATNWAKESSPIVLTNGYFESLIPASSETKIFRLVQ